MTAHVRGTDFTELIDPACVADTFVEGIGEIEKVGASCVRVTLYTTRSVGGGARERIVVARLVLPEATFARGLRQCTAFQDDDVAIDDVMAEGGCH
ncbi:MAG: hypothetical protein J0H71_05380 [Rhizobiales bacterium]|nr:hypothetical protein [Hyphomicrobiales bacterium]